MLAQDTGEFSDWSEQTAPDFVDEMIVGRVKFALFCVFLVRSVETELQLTLYLPHKENVDHNIVLFVVQPVLYSDYLQYLRAFLTNLDHVLVNSKELTLRTAVSRSYQIANFETNQVNLPQQLIVQLQLILRKFVLVAIEVDFTGFLWHFF